MMSNSVVDELLVFVLMLVLCLLAVQLPITRKWELRAVWAIARKPWISVSAVFLLALMICVWVSAIQGLPQPKIHDEFSYLLSGETLYEGRLANEAHPMWQHFETMHVLQQPTYAAKYPMGQGVAIAIGLFLGNPMFGVWLSLAAACAAICWMLQAWMKPHWALFASLLATMRMCTAGYPGRELTQLAYWSQSFWGGAVAMLGGALLFGGLRRHARRLSFGSSMAFAGGIIVLSHSRPFEGLILTVPCLVAYGWFWCSGKEHVRSNMAVAPLSMAVILVLNFVFIAVQNYAVTRNPLQLPYSCYEQSYSLTRPTLFQPLRRVGVNGGPEYRHAAMREFHAGWEAREFTDQLSLRGYLHEKSKRLGHLWEFFVGPVLTLPILAFAVAHKTLWQRFSVVALLLPLAFHAFTPWMHPHYVAPVAGLVYLWVAEGVRNMDSRTLLGKHFGKAFAAAALISVAVGSALSVYNVTPQTLVSAWHLRRAALERRLTDSAEQHLVIVRYDPTHSPHQEWVYNHANLEESAVVWARDMGLRNDEIAKHFPSRRAWLLDIHGGSEKLCTYPDLQIPPAEVDQTRITDLPEPTRIKAAP